MAKSIDILTLARLGVWLDDPYGDGIRLEAIRNPSLGREAALSLLHGQPTLDFERVIRDEYEQRVLSSYFERVIRDEYEQRVLSSCFTKSGKLRADVKRNCDLLPKGE
jgi:hypothetical protein